MIRLPTLILGICIAGAIGCAKNNNDDDQPQKKGAVIGSIKTLDDKALPAGVVLKVNNQAIAINEQGWFAASDVVVGPRVMVTIAAPGYVDLIKPVAVVANRQTFVDAVLIPLEETTTINGAAGGTVTNRDGDSVMIPPNSLVNAAGETYTGEARVSLTNLDPTNYDEQKGISGDFTGITNQGETPVLIESFGMANLVITDSDGNKLNIAQGSTVTLGLASSGQSFRQAESSVGLWRFDETQSVWVRTGDAPFNSNTNTYEVPITTTGMWNADQPYATACFSGRIVTPELKPAVGGITVFATGSTYVGNSTAFTDDNGKFILPVKQSANGRTETVYINAQGGGFYLKDPIAKTTPTSLMSTDNCEDIGDITLAYPLARFVLTWGEKPSDLDSHFTGPTSSGERFHLYYSNSELNDAVNGRPMANLDTDDTSSFGPEVVSLFTPLPGTYVYSVKNFSGENDGPIKESGMKVQAFLPNEVRSFSVSDANGTTSSDSTTWRGFKFTIEDDGTFGPITPIQTIVDNNEDDNITHGP